MLTERQQEIFSFIKKFIDQNDRPPRLKEFNMLFNIGNKAILDHLTAIEREGHISMPDGVLSLKIVNRYKNDIFISYSSEDLDVAQKIYDYFKNEGFKVWKDNMELQSGDDFIKKIFENIRDSKCVLVLLSANALSSSFVREEVASAKSYFISHGKPLILPVKIKTDFDSTIIFPELKSLQYYTLGNLKDEKELMALANRVHTLAYEHNINRKQQTLKNRTLISFLRKTEKDILDELTKVTPPPTKQIPYWEVIVSPVEVVAPVAPLSLEDIMKRSLVEMRGWGGDRFPALYYEYNHGPKIVSDGLRFVDNNPWLEQEWSFTYWKIDKNYNFLHRNLLREAFSARENLKNKFSIEWLLLDTIRPLKFIENLIRLTGVQKWKIRFKYVGLRDRELVILSTNRHGFFHPYKCFEDEIQSEEIEINETTDLRQVARQLYLETVLCFQWRDPHPNNLEKDIDRMFRGIFLE